MLKYFIDFILHIDVHLVEIVGKYEAWTFLILFAIVFCETGLVIMPFLPGDSLLFAAGSVTAIDGSPLSIGPLILIIFCAAVLGDNTNYFVGRFLGEKIIQKNYRWFKKDYLYRTQDFYEKHGGKTVIVARFAPILRTFAPFVAGLGRMKYSRFFTFSVIGNILWVNSFCLAGHFFGNIPVVKNNFTLVIMVIIVISLLPAIITVVKARSQKANLA